MASLSASSAPVAPAPDMTESVTTKVSGAAPSGGVPNAAPLNSNSGKHAVNADAPGPPGNRGVGGGTGGVLKEGDSSSSPSAARAQKRQHQQGNPPPPAASSAGGNMAASAMSATSASTTSGASGEQTISYSAERIIGNGSFGVVFQAAVVETGEIVAIKKVLQDKRFKNRELQIMRQLVKDPHSNIVGLKHCFYSQVRFSLSGRSYFQ